jgi:uncharacterized membrane protein (DUF373 family)
MSSEERARAFITKAFSRFEDVVYVGLGVILAYTAAALLVTGGKALVVSIAEGAPLPGIVQLLDRALLVLMVVELLYTVNVSFKQHTLTPEPFLVVGLIAATRRILIVTAEFSTLMDKDAGHFQRAMIEVALLTVMVLALVFSLRLLRARVPSPNE